MTMVTIARNPGAEIQQPRDAASWLGLAASPSFALMAWISWNDMEAMMGSSAHGVLPVSGMTWMYLLMGLFHLAPWLKLASARSRRLTQSIPQITGD